jgi:hypothetical protein
VDTGNENLHAIARAITDATAGIAAPVVGNYYAKVRAQQVYDKMLTSKSSSTLYLVFEPGNKFDVNAIAVYDDTRMNMLGHLDRDSALKVTRQVHGALDGCGQEQLMKCSFRLRGASKPVGGRVYVTIQECEVIAK